ncbi:circadian clock protein LdpA [Leptolyngbya sp. FACHB-261]|uniref:circadian clock protein LdpA n=1 Tax=Leptolyngbya sp. FACHB-261 TaxID=2692806 RepID=UPI0016830543|nr:LdpA C-terminal domain-containing domain [Leptolyngbya sp. FACHB-261]MBD2105217.1 4Fe-4S ferredoxin [Leptolyngbya sp. FACHB-261]
MLQSLSLSALQEGSWFKLICGASFQHLPSVRSLSLVYALAGADCIDVAADEATVASAQEGLAVAERLGGRRPWLMVSLNDAEDPHFRKAKFDSVACPQSCPRPCEQICPADAITFKAEFSGVLEPRCYGCGRCLPVCPSALITAQAYVYAPDQIVQVLLGLAIDAVEIHTQPGQLVQFRRLWQALTPLIPRLKLVAVSCPDGEDLREYLQALWTHMQPQLEQWKCDLLWQTDGRPMSGDIGDGATRAAVRLGQKVSSFDLPGYVQLAGGTNAHTVAKAKAAGLDALAGVAYGSYARALVAPWLEVAGARLEEHPQLLQQAVQQARSLVQQLKPLDKGRPVAVFCQPS